MKKKLISTIQKSKLTTFTSIFTLISAQRSVTGCSSIFDSFLWQSPMICRHGFVSDRKSNFPNFEFVVCEGEARWITKVLRGIEEG